MSAHEPTLHIRNLTTRRARPRAPFAALKDAIVGSAYDVSLVFIGIKRSRELNKKCRGKNSPANILTFPLSKTEGEIFITPSEARRDAPRFGRTYHQFIVDLFIHGLFHLKGEQHGSKMERHEKRVRKKFEI